MEALLVELAREAFRVLPLPYALAFAAAVVLLVVLGRRIARMKLPPPTPQIVVDEGGAQPQGQALEVDGEGRVLLPVNPNPPPDHGG